MHFHLFGIVEYNKHGKSNDMDNIKTDCHIIPDFGIHLKVLNISKPFHYGGGTDFERHSCTLY